MQITLKEPTAKEFNRICLFVSELQLDDRDLQKSQFTIALYKNEVIGFGRLRNHIDCLELCSLGVVKPYRRKNVAEAIVNELIKKSSKEIYLVCIIPEFFTPFGFKCVKKYPVSIQHKLDYCINELVVPEKYVVMKTFVPRSIPVSST